MSHHQMSHHQMSHHEIKILKTSCVELSFLLELKKPLPSRTLKRHNPSWLATTMATAVLVADSLNLTLTVLLH
jgi:hypothetical protein